MSADKPHLEKKEDGPPTQNDKLSIAPTTPQTDKHLASQESVYLKDAVSKGNTKGSELQVVVVPPITGIMTINSNMPVCPPPALLLSDVSPATPKTPGSQENRFRELRRGRPSSITTDKNAIGVQPTQALPMVPTGDSKTLPMTKSMIKETMSAGPRSNNYDLERSKSDGPMSAGPRPLRVRLASTGQLDGEISAGGTFRPKPLNLKVVKETNLTPTAQEADQLLRVRRIKQNKRRSLPPVQGDYTNLPTIQDNWDKDDIKKATLVQ